MVGFVLVSFPLLLYTVLLDVKNKGTARGEIKGEIFFYFFFSVVEGEG
jgi:hypothetical protein